MLKEAERGRIVPAGQSFRDFRNQQLSLRPIQRLEEREDGWKQTVPMVPVCDESRSAYCMLAIGEKDTERHVTNLKIAEEDSGDHLLDPDWQEGRFDDNDLP